MSEHVFLAIDLGAGSGRVIAAKTDFSKISIEEIHRFDNPGIDLPALLLTVPSRGICHLPTVDHEAAVDLERELGLHLFPK